MVTESVTCIALPAGLTADGQGRLAVLVLPALHPDGAEATLDQFAFHAWPDLLAGARWRVRGWDAATDIAPQRLPHSARWPVLFPAGLLVRAPAPEALAPVVTTYPAQRVADAVCAHRAQGMLHGAQSALRALHADAGGGRHGLQADVLLRADGGAMRRLIDQADDAARARRSAGEADFSATGRDHGDLESALAIFAAFHQQPVHSEQQMNANAAADAAAPDTRLDLHQRVSLLLHYPAMLRELGLLIDAVLPLAGFTGATDLSVELLLPEGTTLTAAPPPSTRVERAGFRAVPRAGPPGFADLAATSADGTPRYAIAGFDVDAAGHELLGLLRSRAERAPADHHLQVRSVGLGLLERERAASLYAAAGHAGALMARRDAAFAAEDLLCGHRVDILEERSGRWSSLHARRGEYLVDGMPPLEAADEGVLVSALSQPERSAEAVRAGAHDQAQRSLLAETLMVWNGWSLATPHPTIPMAGAPAADAAAMPMQVIWSTPAGSLPRLRFGARYRVRLRTVDLAGGGLTLDQADRDTPAAAILPPPEAPGWPFLRAEPIGAPLLRDRTAGRAAQAVEEPLLLLRDAGASSASNDIVLQAPPASRQLAEWSGMFDAAFGPDGDPASLMALAEQQALPDPWAGALVIRDCPGIPSRQMLRISADGVSVDALPAPLGQPVESLLVVELAALAAWPEPAGITVRLGDGESAPGWDGAARVLTLHLPAGQKRVLQISVQPRAERLSQFAAFDCAREQLARETAAGILDGAAAGATLAALERTAGLGLLPDVSSPGTLTLVHAVRLPPPPVIAAFPPPVRAAADAGVALAGSIAFDRARTGRIRLRAQWREPDGLELHAEILDLPVDAAPEDLPAGVAIADGVLTLTGRSDPLLLRGRIVDALAPLHAALATLRRVATTAGIGVQAFDFHMAAVADALSLAPDAASFRAVQAEIGKVQALAAGMLDQDIDPDPGDGPPFGPMPVQRAARAVANSARTVEATCATALRELAQPHLRQQFSDGRHRMVDYTASAQTRYIDCYRGDDGAARGVDSAPVRVAIPASIRPLPPRVADTVPVFRWNRAGSGANERTSTRACGLRIYLERPWFSSGEGELLAVLLRVADDTPGPDRLPFISRWARDPAFAGPVPASEPTHLQVRAEAATTARLLVPGVRGHLVDTIGLAPQLDTAGRLHVDVYLDAGAVYSPFTQLAVARFQPASLPGLELSEPVILDPLPLLPPRTLTATRGAGGALTLRLSGPGHATTGRPNLYRATVQQRLPGTADDAGWQAVAQAATVEELPGEDAVLWAARVAAIAGMGELRVQVEEHERYLGGAEPLRLVYAEHVML